MPQELRVVDIVKKANKWVCKMCSVKQSLAREYFRGSGQDCRSMVQQLSVRHLEMDQREAEVAKLVLQNKIQLPQPPPMDPVDLRNEATKGSIPTSQEPIPRLIANVLGVQ
uniref:MRN complex-interacting protein N-terminal domain-containing protein n=1 Tax=Anopheles christyi TaxID=43041 RepID=A0A182K4T3_9DIPT